MEILRFLLTKLKMLVIMLNGGCGKQSSDAAVAQSVERRIGRDEASSSKICY